MEGWQKVVMPFAGMVMAMVSQSGSMVVSKAAMSDGMNKYVMAVYSFALSSFFLLPLASLQYCCRPDPPPPLTLSTLCSFFLLALVGCSEQIMGYVGIELSSPTLASAMLNLIPGFTFVLALIFRMEEVYWRRFSTQAKVLGTIVSIAGAFVVILFKGPPIFKAHPSTNLLQFSDQVNWILGGLFCVGDSFLKSVWYIYQASITKKYPALTVIVFFQMFFQTMQSAVFALFAVRVPQAWALRLDIGLVSVLYQAIGANVIRYLLLTWCIKRAGPLFCTMFKPVGIIFTVIMGAIFLGDVFYFGSLIGAALIAMGFYLVMWGKATEDKEFERGIEHLDSSMCNNVPLLQNTT